MDVNTTQFVSARDTYRDRRAQIDQRIADLDYALRRFDLAERETAARGRVDWGYAGYAGHILDQLDEIVAALSADALNAGLPR